jgi:hypothetical protein
MPLGYANHPYLQLKAKMNYEADPVEGFLRAPLAAIL